MFHCYRTNMKDSDCVELVGSRNSMISLVSTCLNYSPILTRYRVSSFSPAESKFKKLARRKKRLGSKRLNLSVSLTSSSLPTLSLSVDDSILMGDPIFSGYRTRLSIQFQETSQTECQRGMIENPISEKKTSARCDISEKCADIKLYSYEHTEGTAKITTHNVSLSLSGIVQSQLPKRKCSIVKDRAKRVQNWMKICVKALDCNCLNCGITSGNENSNEH